MGNKLESAGSMSADSSSLLLLMQNISEVTVSFQRDVAAYVF